MLSARATNLYIADTRSFLVRKVSATGIITTVAGGGQGVGDGGLATRAGLTPTAVAVDNAGDLYIADGRAGRVRKLSPSGIITTFAGGGSLVSSADDGGPATRAA